ncbi:MAG TPA: hypothetical protein EYP04_10310, partial [Anaerolineae bacterium]|nr:hypothetical protein [Anaerolineae bacterium]
MAGTINGEGSLRARVSAVGEQTALAGIMRLVDHLIERTRRPCEQALKDAGLSASDIDEVILVG